MNGFINILKPPGMTSAAVVATLRRLCAGEKAGHAGTLDPEAAGVLPVMMGRAARLFDYLVDKQKEYVAEVAFGTATDTQDATGRVIARGENYPTRAQIEAALPALTGEIRQRPSMYSAIKREGTPLYALARRGEEVEVPERVVRVDALRLDHFRAFESYWAVPAGAKTAKEGAWEKGPGMDLLRVLTGWFPQITYIAEDLGILTDAVHQLREESGLPGMKVLEFAFSGPDNAYLPHHYAPHCICYTGTHDNNTVLGWYDHVTQQEPAFAQRYLGVSGAEDVRRALLRLGQGSVAELFVAQMQDYLALGSEGRINVPGVAEGNWRWRMAPGAATKELAADVRSLTAAFGRC